jgi:hypothetical protein
MTWKLESEEMANRGRKSTKSQFTKEIHLSCMPARDKKLSSSVDSLNTHDRLVQLSIGEKV